MSKKYSYFKHVRYDLSVYIIEEIYYTKEKNSIKSLDICGHFLHKIKESTYSNMPETVI
jgi:hypothetical protein